MQLQIVSSEIIKPSCATPAEKRVHRLSFFDQVSPRLYVPVAFFYLKEEAEPNGLMSNELISGRLKNSLSSTLTHYYPLAGRIKDDATVDCNDEGIVYIEAIACDTRLSQIIRHTPGQDLHSLMKLLFPENLAYRDSSSSSPLVVQVTFFSCGGMSLALCSCHKIMDLSGVCNFVKCWAEVARDGDAAASTLVLPEFNLGSMYPPIMNLELKRRDTGEAMDYAGCRLVISALNLAKLKEMAREEVHNPTRAEVVLALIFSCAGSLTDASSGPRPSVLQLAVNMRKRVYPHLLDTATGNLTWSFSVRTSGETAETDLLWLVGAIRRAKTEFFNEYSNIRKEELAIKIVESWKRRGTVRNESDSYRSTSWCRFPLYEVADFGWGKPVWVTSICCEFRNTIVMMDTRGGGVEVFVTLGAEEMALFKRDEKLLLQFALVNPYGLPDLDDGEQQ